MPHEDPDDSHYHNDHIECVPPVIEYSLPVADIFDYELARENEGKNVIQVFERLINLLGLPVPLEREDNGVNNDANHDEYLDILALSYEKEGLAHLIKGHLHAVLRLSLQNVETIVDPLLLLLSEVEILAIKFTLSVVLGYHDAHEEVEQEEITHNDDKGKEETGWYALNFFACYQILTSRMESRIKCLSPLYCIRNYKQSGHGVQG